MDTLLESGWGQLSNSIDWAYLIVFMLLSYIVKRNFQTGLNKLFKKEIHLVYIVLFIATFTGILNIVILKAIWTKVLLTYTLGTSLHELFFTWIEKKVNTFINI